MFKTPLTNIKASLDIPQEVPSIAQILQPTGAGQGDTASASNAGNTLVSAAHLKGRNATHPGLHAAYQRMPEGINKLKKMTLFRGISGTPDMAWAVKDMMAKKPTTMPVMWGFRAYQPGRQLLSKEIKTLDAIAADIQKLKDEGLNVTAPILIADLHAEHNNVPPDAVPQEQGGAGNEGYKAYYAKVAEEAGKRGIPTVKLSDIFAKLKLTPHQIAERGAELTRTPGDDKNQAANPNTTYLSKDDINAYTRQAQHMVARYPTIPVNREILEKPDAEKHQALEEKALDYIRFRKGEGEMLLPRLPEFFRNNVIPVHVSDPGAGTIGVEGVYIYSKSGKDKNVADIPWKGEGKDIINSGKLSEGEVKAAKLVTQVLGLKYGADFEAAVRVAVKLSGEGLSDFPLVMGAWKALAMEQEIAKIVSQIDKSAIDRALSKETGLKGQALRDMMTQKVNERVENKLAAGQVREQLEEKANAVAHKLKQELAVSKMNDAESAGKAMMEYAQREANLLPEELKNYGNYGFQ